jgi:hypothetical protein
MPIDDICANMPTCSINAPRSNLSGAENLDSYGADKVQEGGLIANSVGTESQEDVVPIQSVNSNPRTDPIPAIEQVRASTLTSIDVSGTSTPVHSCPVP